MIFIDNKTIASSNIGGIVRALIYHWQTYHPEDWLNRVDFLQPG